MGMLLAAEARDALDGEGGPETGSTLLLLLSNARRSVPFRLPDLGAGRWRPLLDTARPNRRRKVAEDQLNLPAYCMLLLEREPAA